MCTGAVLAGLGMKSEKIFMSPKSRPDRHFFWGCLAALGIAGLFSCSASDEPPFGGRVESPIKASSPPPSSISPSPSSSASSPPVANVHPGPPYPTGTGPYPFPPYLTEIDYERIGPPPPSTWWGLKLSPLEKIIADTCPSQAWSQNVPDIDCTEDGECGDGFCDRGHCSAIWTCGQRLGQRCEKDNQCGGFCIGGRCRSCLWNAECAARGGHSDFVCGSASLGKWGRNCGSLAPKAKRPFPEWPDPRHPAKN